jgi:hypothetical protein
VTEHYAYFWYVEVERSESDPEVPYRAIRLTFDLHVYEERGERWVEVGKVKVPDLQPCPTLEYYVAGGCTRSAQGG